MVSKFVLIIFISLIIVGCRNPNMQDLNEYKIVAEKKGRVVATIGELYDKSRIGWETKVHPLEVAFIVCSDNKTLSLIIVDLVAKKWYSELRVTSETAINGAYCQ